MDENGFPTIFQKALHLMSATCHGGDDAEHGGETECDSVCSPRTPCPSPASTCYYDSDGFPVMRARSMSGFSGFGGSQMSECEILGDQPEDGDANMQPINPSSRKRRTEALSAAPPKPRGRPRKDGAQGTPKTPKQNKRSKQTAKTPKSREKAVAPDGLLSRLCCSVSDKPQPRAELTGYVAHEGGFKRVHVCTLTLKGWGQSYATDARALKQQIAENGWTKSQALDARDMLLSCKS